MRTVTSTMTLKFATLVLTGVIILLGAGYCLAIYSHRLEPASAKERDHRVLENDAILVTTSVDLSVLPPELRRAPVSFRVDPLPDDDAQYWKCAINGELSKYNQNSLSRSLREVRVVKRLSFSGIEAGGTVYNGIVWISIESSVGPNEPSVIRALLHHEVGTAIFHSLKEFDIDEWEESNGMPYSGISPIYLAGKSRHPLAVASIDLLQAGFVTEYSRSMLLKDCSTIHQYLMTCTPTEISCLSDKFPRLGKKFRLWQRLMVSQGLVIDDN